MAKQQRQFRDRSHSSEERKAMRKRAKSMRANEHRRATKGEIAQIVAVVVIIIIIILVAFQLAR